MKAAQVGDLATLCYPSDLYPYIVTAVSPTGRKATIAPIDYTKVQTLAGYHNGFPVHDHSFTAAEALEHVQRDWPRTAYLGANGYTEGGTPLTLGVARYRRDYSD